MIYYKDPEKEGLKLTLIEWFGNDGSPIGLFHDPQGKLYVYEWGKVKVDINPTTTVGDINIG